MGCLWDERVSAWVFAVSLKLDQLASRRPMGWVRGAGMQAGVSGRQRRRAGAKGICKCTCAYERRECDMCACASDLPSLSAQEGGTWLSVFYVSPTCGCF